MSLSVDQKKAVISEVTEAIASAQAGILAEYRGLNVAQITALRTEARNAGVWVRVVKNNLAKRVIRGSDFECLTDHFTGPVIFSASEDPVSVAKVMAAFAKDNEKLKITAGAMNGALIDCAMIQRLSKLPGRDQLIARLMATIQAPIQKLAATLNEVPSKFVRTLCAVAEAKKAA
ncbi:50S ribosomal protein L10 [Candidatus Spongiihabitans sp.]|uniref:50S ribosomal protein L10 n=1 Tax=Candidatus Spongiihabitans sp. TaxID=3101308 RepID=UPI003C7B5503